MTLERTGRSMKNFEIMPGPIWPMAGGGSIFCSLRIDLLAGDRAQQARDHDLVVRLEAAFDHAQIALERAGLHLALLDDIVAVHHQHIAPGLVAAERHVGHQQRVLLLVEGNADADEIAGQQHAVGDSAARRAPPAFRSTG